MCRLLGYFGSKIQLNKLLYEPEHSLVVQSYQPQAMTSGLLNADGFGIGWYHPAKETTPYTYKNILPIWSDINLPQISRYVESNCILGYVRSATPPSSVDLSNCQPFTWDKLLFIHNGLIRNFRQTLYRPLRKSLDDDIYQLIQGTTDSEHIFALILQELASKSKITIATALGKVLTHLTQLAESYQVDFSVNMILSNGNQLIASRYAHGLDTPSLYWLKDQGQKYNGVIIASEPLFRGNWNSCPAGSIISVGENLEVRRYSVS